MSGSSSWCARSRICTSTLPDPTSDVRGLQRAQRDGIVDRVDRQELTVPANYRSGIYTFWIGFFSGNNRLEVTPEDKNDGADRLNAGRLRVR